MKTACDCFEKGHGTPKKRKKKKKQIVFKNKIETDVPNKKKFGRTHEFCFTNMKIVLQKCIPNKPLAYQKKKKKNSINSIVIWCSKHVSTGCFHSKVRLVVMGSEEEESTMLFSYS